MKNQEEFSFGDNMNITVFLSSKPAKDPVFSEKTKYIGNKIASEGHTLVFGGSNSGLMADLCNSALAGGAKVIGVEPDTPFIRAKAHPGLSEVIWTASMSERKEKMLELADVILVLPGGSGTFDEMGDIVQANCVGNTKKPCVIVNIAGFYDPLYQLFDNMSKQGYNDPRLDRICIMSDIDEIFSMIAGKEF